MEIPTETPGAAAGTGGCASPMGETGKAQKAKKNNGHDTTGGTMLSAALAYAAAGIPVFPCGANKRPITDHGFKDASTDAEQIRAWWTTHPSALIGRPTGAASGVIALDVDSDPDKGIDGEESLAVLLRHHGPLPATWEVITPRGGRHLYFRHPGFSVPCSAGKLGSGLDIRCDGGYVVTPPSVLPDGRGYVWEGSSDPNEGALLADAPAWFLTLATQRGGAPHTAAREPGDENEAAPQRIKEGTRNPDLFSLGRSMRAKGMTANGILAALRAENEERCNPPLSDAEVVHIAGSVCSVPPGPSAQYARPKEPSPYGEPGYPWPDPESLSGNEKLEPYPVDALPKNVRLAVTEVADFVKAPIALVATSALSALSVACQAHVDAKRAEKLQGPTGLYLLAIADTGERKTTCDGFFTPMIGQYDVEQIEVAQAELERHEAQKAAWTAEREGLLLAIKTARKAGKATEALKSELTAFEREKPVPPRVPGLLLGDETPENLAWHLATQWASGAVISSDAGIIFGSHGMGKDSIMRNLALLNLLWDGGTHTVGRRGTGRFTVRGARLTLGLQIQEETLRSFFESGGGLARGIGFFARFLLSWPQSTQGARLFTEAPDNWPHLAAFHARIAAILAIPAPVNDDGSLSPLLLGLTPAAKAAWIGFHDAIEVELRPGGELYDVRDVANKIADNAVRLAALFQMFESGPSTIGKDIFDGAGRIAAWHLYESRRFFGELRLPAELADAERLDTWLLDYCRRERSPEVPTREAQRLGPVRDKGRLAVALHELTELGRVRVTHEGRRRTIKVNPVLVEATP